MPDLTDNHAHLELLESQSRELTPGLMSFQETNALKDGRFSNLYWVEIDKNKFNFTLSASTSPIPLLDFNLANRKVIAGINFGSFFLSDDLHTPVTTFYNLMINSGKIFQFPSNTRPALKSKDGKLSEIKIPANGTLNLGNQTFTWSGSNSVEKTDLKIFGMFDLTIGKIKFDKVSTRRKILSETSFVTCDTEETLLGINISKGQPKLERIIRTPLDLTQFAYVIKGNSELLKKAKVGQEITGVRFGRVSFDDENVCSASFSLGKTRDELINNLRTQLIFPKGGEPKPMSKDYLKSWSVVLETKDKIIFFIGDARPKVKNQEGLSVFELQTILQKKFDYSWACVGDSGQSSKLMVIGDTAEIYGNMHYQNYSGKSPVWDGKNGRHIPVALLAYE